jgi:DNA topoisomerase-1
VITAQDGKFGPYLRMGSESRSLENHEKLEHVTLDRGGRDFQATQGPQGGRRAAVIAELGEHPESGDTIKVKNGRFGPYVTDGVVNATIPKGHDPAKISLEKASSCSPPASRRCVIRARTPAPPRRRKPGKRSRPRKRRPRKTTKKKTTKKKAATAKKKTSATRADSTVAGSAKG